VLSCTNKNSERETKNLIPEKDLIPMIIDIHMVDALMTLKMNDSLNFEPKKLNNAVFTKYHTSRKEFDQTIKYYSQKPQLLDSLYEKILVRMSEMKAEISNKKNEVQDKKNKMPK
jgi:hypothetical protein